MIDVLCGKCGSRIKVIGTEDGDDEVCRKRKCEKCGCVFFTSEFVNIGAAWKFKKCMSDRRNKNELHG